MLDPACGGGAFLIAVGDLLVRRGVPPGEVVASLSGFDLDPGAVEATRAAIGVWADRHDVDGAAARIEVADALVAEIGTAELVIGNPPFQGQLFDHTARDASAGEALRERYGTAVTAYVDTALLFLLAGARALDEGGVLAMIQPWSALSTSHGTAAREAVLSSAHLRAAWVPDARVFDAEVDVWAPVLSGGAAPSSVEVRHGADTLRISPMVDGNWARIAAAVNGVPEVEPRGAGCVGDVAVAVSGFRDEFYVTASAIHEAGDPSGPSAGADRMRVVTSGAIDPFTVDWGGEPMRIARRSWSHPVVSLASLNELKPRVATWARRQRGPKVVVANQTRVIEVAADHVGDLLAITPVVAVVPHDPSVAGLLAAALSAPSLSALLHHRRGGAGQSKSGLRISASDLLELPMPEDLAALSPVLDAVERGAPWPEVGRLADAAFGVEDPAVIEWWVGRLPRRLRRDAVSD